MTGIRLIVEKRDVDRNVKCRVERGQDDET